MANIKHHIVPGEKFNNLTILREVRNVRNCKGIPVRTVDVQCVCKEIITKPFEWVKKGWIKSCGCVPRNRPNKLPKGVASLNHVFRVYKSDAKRRGLKFSISLTDFKKLTSSICYYCGCVPKQVKHLDIWRLNGDYIHNGIDRVDNTKGYVFSNCVPCCKTCNLSKRDMTKTEFIDWIIRAYKHITDLQYKLTDSILA